jgi:hypothetical protein
VLLKIQYDRVPKAMMIAPCWPTSAWYPTLLFLIFEHPILLRRSPIRWRWTGDEIFLAAWPVSDSGDNLVVLGFLCKQPISSLVTSVFLCVGKVLWLVWFKTSLYPVQASLAQVAKFLTQEFDISKCYRAMNTCCSALFSVLPTISGKPVGRHPIMHSSLAQRNF